MTRLIGVYGAAGCGRGIMPLLCEQFPQSDFVFIDDAHIPSQINGHDTIKWESFLERENEEKFVSIAIAGSMTRKILAERCADNNIALIEARAKSVIEMDDVIIGDTRLLCQQPTRQFLRKRIQLTLSRRRLETRLNYVSSQILPDGVARQPSPP